MADEVRVEGAKQLRRTMKAAGLSLSDLKASHKQAADIAARASSALAPRGATGRLARSVRGSGTNTAGIIRAGTKAVPYAPAIHWGRRYWPNKKSPRAVRSIVRGRPFISTGTRNSEGQWLPVYLRQLDDTIQRIEGL